MFIILMGSEVEVTELGVGKGCLTIAASAEDVRKYGEVSENGDTESESTISFNPYY